MTQTQFGPEATWPSISLSYDLLRPSYDIALRRLEALDLRLQTLLTFVGGLTTAVPIFAISAFKELSPRSPWLLLAMAMFLAVFAVGWGTRAHGRFKMVGPDLLYQDYLHFPEWEFKKNVLYWGGQDFLDNLALVNLKARWANAVTLLFLGQLLFYFIWIAEPR